MCEGASKQTPDLKILPRRDRAPRFEIPGSATEFQPLPNSTDCHTKLHGLWPSRYICNLVHYIFYV